MRPTTRVVVRRGVGRHTRAQNTPKKKGGVRDQHANPHTHIHAHTRTYTHTHTRARAHAHAHAHAHARMNGNRLWTFARRLVLPSPMGGRDTRAYGRDQSQHAHARHARTARTHTEGHGRGPSHGGRRRQSRCTTARPDSARPPVSSRAATSQPRAPLISSEFQVADEALQLDPA